MQAQFTDWILQRLCQGPFRVLRATENNETSYIGASFRQESAPNKHGFLKQ